MDLESVLQSEVSQKKKNNYCILTPDILECEVKWTLGSRHSMAHSFIELHKPLLSDKTVIHEGAGKLRELNMIYIELHFPPDSE